MIYICINIYIHIHIFIHICYIYIYVLKTIYPRDYHRNTFVETHTLRHMMFGYTLLVPMNQWLSALCLAGWALFGSLVPAMCNSTSCAQVHELPQNYCGDNWEGTLFSWLHIYYAHLASVTFKHSVYHGSLMTTYIMLLA